MLKIWLLKGVGALAVAGIVGSVGVPAVAEANAAGRGLRYALVRAVLHTTAEQTGLERCDMLGDLAEGQTLSEIAQGAGIEPQSIVDAVMTRLAERLEKAVAKGRITQERADEILAAAPDRLAEFMQAELSERAARQYERLCAEE